MSRHALPRWLLLFCFAVFPAGCVKEYLSKVRGPGFDERSREFAAEAPAREDAGRPFSFSTKAREIEQNFGFD
ncbi:MAG: hypothetical protein KY475_02345 [Planctomycetes bacterium]|nr:hypothetical protein [Planctomycetota bacterium]